MKAMFIREHGGVDAFVYGELPEPRIGADEMLVRVRAAGVNRRDIFVREGSHGVRPPLPAIPGIDFAGEVAVVGEQVNRFRVGERVMGVGVGGTYAEYVRAPAAQVQPIPDGIGYEEAAAVPTVFTAAWHMLVSKAKVAAGEDVLVIGAGSGVGSAAIQIAVLHGARVVTTASTDEKLEKAAALGAAAGINYRREDVVQRVRELTAGEGVDIAVDHVGAPVWEHCFKSLKLGGRFVTCGVTAGHRVELHLGQLWTRELTLIGTRMYPREDLGTIVKLIGRRQLRGVVHAVYPLAEAGTAHRVLEESTFFGKLVLTVP